MAATTERSFVRYSETLEKEIILLLDDPSETASLSLCLYVQSLSYSSSTPGRVLIPTTDVYVRLLQQMYYSESNEVALNLYALLVELQRTHSLSETRRHDAATWLVSSLESDAKKIGGGKRRLPTLRELIAEIEQQLAVWIKAGDDGASPLPDKLLRLVYLLRYYVMLLEDDFTLIDAGSPPTQEQQQQQQRSEIWKCFADPFSPQFSRGFASCFAVLSTCLASTADECAAEPSSDATEQTSRTRRSPSASHRSPSTSTASSSSSTASSTTASDEVDLEVRSRILYEIRTLLFALLNICFRLNAMDWLRQTLGQQHFLNELLDGYASLRCFDAKIEFVCQMDNNALKLSFLDKVLCDYQPTSSANKSFRDKPVSLEKVTKYFFHLEVAKPAGKESPLYAAQSQECLTFLLCQLLQSLAPRLVEAAQKLQPSFVTEADNFCKKLSRMRHLGGAAGKRVVANGHVISMTVRLLQQLCRRAYNASLSADRDAKRPRNN